MDAFSQQHEFFVGIDSDGCVFDSMELKWKECFIPQTIVHFNLQGVSKFAREALEFVNLYSKDRGSNRFVGLIKSLDLLSKRPEVAARGFASCCAIAPSLRSWVEQAPKLGEPALSLCVDETADEGLMHALAWSRAVNQAIAEMVHGVPPFPGVRKSLQLLAARADMIVCSATPNAALQAEWSEHGIEKYVSVIFGQEAGRKQETLAVSNCYKSNHKLMIGDAPGDYSAAIANNCLFYPINPGYEETSWRRFHDEAIEKFFRGEFAGDYQQNLLDEFNTYLPEHPPWSAD